jgi:membrane protein implicated in regulation of membrane protease activity
LTRAAIGDSVSSPMLIYAGIGAFGLLLLLAMLLMGEIVGGDHEVSGEIAHDADHGGGPSVLSVRVMAAFLTAFGVGGVVARYYGLSHPIASGIGVLAGVVMAGMVYQFAKILYAQQASTNLTMRRLVGEAGVVSVAIPANGVGQVALSAGGELTEHLARSADGRAVARGTAIVITALGGDSVLVRPAAAETPASPAAV